jgi:DNA-binding response OmpR family regulator
MAEPARVLVVEDDAIIREVLILALEDEGYDVRSAIQGHRALEELRTWPADLIILDLMLPGVSGFDLCRAFHDTCDTPILVLTARSQKADKIRCLDYGADDYLTKPFDLEELFARIRAILRRTRPSLETLTIGSITVDFRSRLAVRDNTDLRLTHKEFEILHYLAEREGHVVHRDELLKDLWGYAQQPFTRSVDTAMARLRKKIESDSHHPRFIHTVHGDGYCLTPHGQTSV